MRGKESQCLPMISLKKQFEIYDKMRRLPDEEGIFDSLICLQPVTAKKLEQIKRLAEALGAKGVIYPKEDGQVVSELIGRARPTSQNARNAK